MLIKRFINIYSQKRSYLNFFDFFQQFIETTLPLCSHVTAIKLTNFLRNVSIVKIKKNSKYRYHFNKNYN